MSRRLTVEQVISGFKEVHGDRYDYSLITDYKNNAQKLPIICPEHGVFYQEQYIHKNGHGCPICGKNKADNIRRVQICAESFVDKARKIHGNKYDYSKVEYKNNCTPVCIICPEHGEFWQVPYSHLNKKRYIGCPICGKAKNQLGNKHKQLECSKNFEQKAREVHGDKYDYSKVEYKGATKKVTIICPKHGEFEQVVSYHLSGNGCPRCVNHISKWEQEVFKMVDSWFPGQVHQSRKGLIPGRRHELDIWIPHLEIGIECDGLHWHSDSFEKNSILFKQDASIKNGFRLINLFEDEWNLKRDVVESRLKSILGICTHNKIYARQCRVREVSNQVAKEFLNKNHLQGGNPYCHKALGLYHKEILVSVMLFCKPRIGFGNGKQVEGRYELVKFASLLNTIVIGAASKLLNYFIKNSDATEIYSFADRRWSDGNLYEKLGFEKVSVNPPNYFYIINDRRVNRFGFRKSELVRQGFDASKTEAEIMRERKIERIYDAGTVKYTLKIDR